MVFESIKSGSKYRTSLKNALVFRMQAHKIDCYCMALSFQTVHFHLFLNTNQSLVS